MGVTAPDLLLPPSFSWVPWMLATTWTYRPSSILVAVRPQRRYLVPVPITTRTSTAVRHTPKTATERFKSNPRVPFFLPLWCSLLCSSFSPLMILGRDSISAWGTRYLPRVILSLPHPCCLLSPNKAGEDESITYTILQGYTTSPMDERRQHVLPTWSEKRGGSRLNTARKGSITPSWKPRC